MKTRLMLKKKGIELLNKWFTIENAHKFGIFIEDNYLLLEGHGEVQEKDENGKLVPIVLENENTLISSFRQTPMTPIMFEELKPHIITKKAVKLEAA